MRLQRGLENHHDPGTCIVVTSCSARKLWVLGVDFLHVTVRQQNGVSTAWGDLLAILLDWLLGAPILFCLLSQEAASRSFLVVSFDKWKTTWLTWRKSAYSVPQICLVCQTQLWCYSELCEHVSKGAQS